MNAPQLRSFEIFDLNAIDARLIGIEYIISEELLRALSVWDPAAHCSDRAA